MASMQPDALVQNYPASFVATGEIVAPLGRCAAVPMESVWVPAGPAKAASVEIEGSFSTLSVQLLGSNSPSDPGNTYTATIGGTTFDSGDVVSLIFTNPNLPNGEETVSHTLGASETAATVAAALAAAINADTKLAGALGLGFAATAASAVITITYPSVAPLQPPQEGFSPTTEAVQNTTLVQGSVTGAGNETVTIANASAGAALGSAITTLSITALTVLPRWIKAQFGTLTGTGASATPWLHSAV